MNPRKSALLCLRKLFRPIISANEGSRAADNTVREKDGAAVVHPVGLRPEEVAAIAARVAARVRGLFLGRRAGKRVRRLGSGITRPRRERPPLCAEVQGFDVHAGVAITATTSHAWRGYAQHTGGSPTS